MENLRNKIKELSSEQAGLKNQRKTVKIVGERTVDAHVASYKHNDNRYELRHLYATLAKLRGHEISEVDADKDKTLNYRYITKLEEIYGG